MKLTRFILSLVLILSGCQAPRILGRVMEYSLPDDRFAVVSAQDPGMTTEQTRLAAYTRAAEITAAKGYRFFIVDKEETVQVIESDQPAPMPGNLYQELIMEKGTGRDTLQQQAQTTETTSGIRLTIRFVRDDKSGKAVDACRYTKCQ